MAWSGCTSAVVDGKMANAQGKGEAITVVATAPTIDPTSTTHGVTVTSVKNVPVPGRTFQATVGAAAGSQGDARGVAFSGSTSIDTRYVVDGVDTARHAPRGRGSRRR